MDNPMVVYIVIGVAFIINLIIMLAFRLADKKDRTLKNVNTQIKSFRTEVSTTIARVNATARDCEANIQGRVDQANAANSKLAESLDMLMVHQKELTDLEYICKSYKVALEKLKGQTEQAEARILAVQAEVRKAESINTFTLEFQADAERLINQMQDLKTEYIRLIASTEQSLKNAGQAQLAENDKNLAIFSEAIDRARGELSEFSNNERISIQELFNRQELATQEALEQLDREADKIKVSIEESIHGLDDYRKDLEKSTIELDEKRLEIERSSSEFIAKYKGDLENTGELVADTLEAKIKDKEDEIANLFDIYSEKLSEKESEGDKLLDDIDTKKALVLSSFDSAFDSKRKDIESAIASLENEKGLYVTRSKEALDKAFKDSLSDAEANLDNMKSLSDKLIRHLEDKIAESREVYAIINSSADEKLSGVIASLSDYEDRLKQSKSVFNSLSEEITAKRHELYNMNQQEKYAQDGLNKIYAEVEKAKEEAQIAKESRINEEARVVRLKFQQSALQKGVDAEAKQDESKVEEELYSKRKPEDMIEEFPDDIEFVDLDDEIETN